MHSDLHPGNMILQQDERGSRNLILIDAGLTTKLTERDRKNLILLFPNIECLALKDTYLDLTNIDQCDINELLPNLAGYVNWSEQESNHLFTNNVIAKSGKSLKYLQFSWLNHVGSMLFFQI